MWILFTKAIKFGIVGLSGICIDFLLTWLIKEKLKVNKFVANTIGFIAAVINNYTLNRIWTFADKNPEVVNQFIYFLCVSSVGLGLNSLFLYLFNHKMKFNFYLSKLLAIVIIFIWNFSANLIFTFKNGA